QQSRDTWKRNSIWDGSDFLVTKAASATTKNRLNGFPRLPPGEMCGRRTPLGFCANMAWGSNAMRNKPRHGIERQLSKAMPRLRVTSASFTQAGRSGERTWFKLMPG